MGLDDFSLQSNNGKKYSLKDLKDIKLEDIAKNPKLQKFIKLFDFDGSGAIENRWVNGKNEWQSIFTELKQAAVDDDLSNEEFGLYISKKMPNEDLKLEDVNELLDIASSQGNVKQIGDMTITRMNGFVAIKIKPNTTILAKNVNENGQFSDDDFIEMKTVDSDGKEITVKREEFKTKEGTTQCIVVTRQDSKDESSTTIYGTSSYYIYEIFKGEESLKAMEFYRKGNNEYYVQYSQEGNTITHAKNGDTVESLIQKFGFKDRAEFDRLNPSLKGKKYPIIADSIVVPGHYSAKDNKIVEQGTVYGEQYNYIKTVSEVERRKFKEEHLQKLDEDIFNKLNNLKGLELSNENIGLYFSLNSYPQKTQVYIFNIIEKLAKEGKTPDEIKTYFLSDPNAPKLTRKDGSKVNINLFNEFSIQMHDFVGTQADDTPQSVKGFIQDVMGLDITKGEGKELYDKLSKVGDPYVIMDINEMFSNIYYRTTKEYKDWHSKQVARLNSDGWKSDKSIKTTGEREYLKEYPPISKETALEMYRAVINKMTAQKGQTVTTKYDKFIEDNRDVYLREFATLTLFSLHQSGAGNLQGTAAQKDILNPSKYLLKPVGSFYDKKGKEIYETMMADCYKGNKKFESILKCYTTGYKQAGVPFDKAKMKHCMEVLQNPKSTEAQKKKALEDAFGYQVVNAAQDLIGVANFVDNVTDMALMIYGTGLIGKGLGKAVSFASKASTATRATAVITNTAKGISWGERLTQIGLSATNFAIWEGARFTVNYYTNDIEEDFSYGSGLGKRMAGGAAFGTFAGAWGQFVTQPMLKWIFKTPAQEAVTKEATAFVSKQLKGSSKFTSKEVLGAFNAGQQKAMTSLGKEAVGFASELTGFSIYEIGQKLIVGNDAQIRQILESSEKYTKEQIDGLLKNPEELKKALKETGCADDVIRELTEINVGDVALGQLKTLLSFKAVGQLVYMHRAGKLPPSALNLGKEKPLEFEPIKQNGKTMYKVKYPDGTTRTVADMNGVIALSNMHYQDVTLYKPIEEVLKKDGKMELDEGITLFKNAEGYSVTFKDGTKIEAKDLKDVMGRAQTEYTIMGYENELAQKGKVELPDKQIVTFDRENNVYRTTMEGGFEVEAPSFKELSQTVQKKTACQSIEKTFTDDKKAVMLDEATVIVKQEDGTYRMIVIEDGFPKEYIGKSVEEVLDKSTGVNEGVIAEPQGKTAPQGMNAEEDALIQEPKIENPIEQRLASANDRESFVAIRDEIKKMPDGEEKNRLMQLYLQKYNAWSADPSRPDIRMQYIPEPIGSTRINLGLETNSELANLSDNEVIELYKNPEVNNPKTPEGYKYIRNILAELIERGYKATTKDNEYIVIKLSEADISARARFAKLIENEQPMRKLFTLNNICENNFETEVQSVKQKLLSKYADLLAEGDLLDLKKYIDANPDKITLIEKLMPVLKEIEEGKSKSGWFIGDNEKGKEYKDLIDCLDNLTPEKAEIIDDYISIAKALIDGSFNRPKNLSEVIESCPAETCRAVADVMKDIPEIASNIDNAAILGAIKEKSPNSYKLVVDFISKHKDFVEIIDYEHIYTNINTTKTYLSNIEKNIKIVNELKEKYPEYEEIINVRERDLLNSQDIEQYKVMEKYELLKELDTLFPQEWGRSLSEALFNPRNPHFLVEETLENVKTKVELAKILGAIKVERKGEQISVFSDKSYNYHYHIALDILIRHLSENPEVAEIDVKNIINDFQKLAKHKVTSVIGKEESLLGAYIEPDTYAVRYLQNKGSFKRADDIINTAKFIDKYKFKDADKYKAEAFTHEELITMETFAEKFAELEYKSDNNEDISISDLFTLEEMREISHKSSDELNEKIAFLKANNLDIKKLKDKSLVRWALLNNENVGSSNFNYVKNRVLNSTQENQSPDFSIKTKSDLKMYLMSLKNKNGDSVFNPELSEKVKPESCQIVAQMAYELSKEHDVPENVLENILTKTATEYNINETSIKVAITRANVYKELLKHNELKEQDLSQIYLKVPENGVELVETYFKNPNLPKNARDMADILDKTQIPEAVDFYGELLQKGYEIDDADVFIMHCRDKSEIEISKILMDNIPDIKNFVEFPQFIMAYRNLPVEIVRIIADNKPELLSDRQFSQELYSATYQFNKNGFDISKVKDNINVFKNMSTETVKTFSKKIIEGLCSDSVKMSDINEVAEILNSNLTKEQIADFSWRFNDQEDFGLLASNLKKFAEFKILGLDGKPQSILKYFDYDTINKILYNYTSPEKIDKFYDILKKLQETRLSDTDNRSLLDIMQLKNSFQLADMDNLNVEKLVQILKENPDFANGLNPKSLVLVDDFADFYGKNIYELSKTEKRNLLMTVLKNKNRLTSGNTIHLKNMSLMPTNNEEYVAIMKDISRSLNISLEVLPDEKIAEFNSTLNSLEDYLKTANLEDLNDINLTITHKEFISQIQDILKDLPNSEKAKIQDLFGFKIVDDKLTGYPNNSVEIDLTSITNLKSREAARLVKKAISQYTNNNFITVKDNPELNARLKELSEIMPEIFNQIDGSKDSVVMIKTLQRIVLNPKYNKLSESDKRVLTVATLLHNTDKTSASTGESAFDAYFIAKKFNMSDTEAKKVYSIIENSDLINKFMATSKKETVRNYRGTRINGSEREDTFDLIAFKLKEGNLFELTQMLYSAKEEDGFTRHFDKLLENRIREMKSNDFVLPQTPRSSYHNHAEIMTIPYGDNQYQVKVVYAEDIENFYALIHTPEAGYATGGTRDANFANFEAFRVLNDDKVICTSYVSNGTAGLVKEYHYGFIFDVANDKQYVGYGTDIYSLGKNIPDMVVEYFRDKGIKANRNRGGKFDHRTMISNTLKTLLYGTDYYKLSKSVADQVAVIDNKYNTEIEKLSKARKQFFTERFGTVKITYEQYVSVRNDAKLVNIENQIRQLQQQKRIETEQVQGYSTLKEMDAKYAERLEKIKSQLGNETMSIENLEKIDPEFASAYKEFLSRDGSEHKEDASLLRSGWHNEVLISNPEISAIFTDDISSIPEEYLIKAQEENLPIVVIK